MKMTGRQGSRLGMRFYSSVDTVVDTKLIPHVLRRFIALLDQGCLLTSEQVMTSEEISLRHSGCAKLPQSVTIIILVILPLPNSINLFYPYYNQLPILHNLLPFCLYLVSHPLSV